MTIRLSPRLPSWVHACLAALVLGGGWDGLCADTPKSPASLQSIVISLPDSPGFRFAGYYAAQAKGYFREAGLEVRLEPARPGTSTVSDVVSGRSNYGVAGSDVLLERLNGKPVVLLTTVFQHSALGLAVAGNSPIQTPGDLAGRRVAIDPLPRDVELWAMMLQEGVRSDSIDVVRNFESANEIQDGEAEAMAVYFANRPQMQLGTGDYRILQPATHGIDFYGDSLIASEAEVKENPDRAEKLRAAVKRGWEFALQNPERVVDSILAGVSGLSPEQTRQRLLEEAVAVRELVVPGLVQIGHVNQERWEEMGRLFVALGLAKDAKRMEGFVYTPAEKFNMTGAVFRWTAIGLGLLGLIGGGIVIWNIRLQRLVEQHTAAYR
ncbi:MAG: ABC transporter substrate-binding protein, partial [Opitutaceae bacterium]|nr:ABC transporter substrate-binding protein [Opitutaceae bacterium]